jgi:hypothetical protein
MLAVAYAGCLEMWRRQKSTGDSFCTEVTSRCCLSTAGRTATASGSSAGREDTTETGRPSADPGCYFCDLHMFYYTAEKKYQSDFDRFLLGFI